MKKQWSIYDKLYIAMVTMVTFLYYILEITDTTVLVDSLIGK